MLMYLIKVDGIRLNGKPCFFGQHITSSKRFALVCVSSILVFNLSANIKPFYKTFIAMSEWVFG